MYGSSTVGPSHWQHKSAYFFEPNAGQVGIPNVVLQASPAFVDKFFWAGYREG